MSVTYPRTDVLTAADFLAPDFDLLTRQELSRTAGGQTIGKDLGPQIWKCSLQTVPMEYEDGVSFEAVLNSLDGAIRTFTLYDLRRPYPKNYSDGSFTDSGTLFSVDGSNRHLIRLATLPANFALSAGDYLSIEYGADSPPTRFALHQIMEDITADGSGSTGYFEVRPAIREAITIGSPGPAVTLKLPPGLFTLVPGSIRRPLKGPPHMSIGFDAIEAVY